MKKILTVEDHLNGHSMMGTTHSYESEPYRDDGFVNLLFHDMIVVVVLVIKVEYIDALISYGIDKSIVDCKIH